MTRRATSQSSAPDDQPTVFAPRFVGRAAELGALTRILVGGPAVVLIEGEAGIGKSRLLAEYLTSTDSAIAVGDCPPFRQPQTLGPVVDAVGKAADSVRQLDLSPLAGALRPLFPEWAHELPSAPEPAEDASAARHRLFRALAELLAALDITALAIEDAHWADETTLEFLLFLAFRQPQRLSVIVTYRPDDVPAGSLLPRLTSRLPAGAASLRLTLDPLDTHATAEMVSSMLSMEQISGTFASFVHEHTEGMPLAIEETIRLMADRADLTMRNGGWARRSVSEIAVPASIRDAVLERTSRLDTAAQRVLHAAAVLASPADHAVLATVCGLAAGPVHEGLSAALGTGLLHADERGRVSFRHVLAARACYDTMLAPDRRAMHLRAGQALRAATATPPAQLARHFREAGETVTWCEYAEQAASLAVASGDEATAMELLDDLMTAAGRPCLDTAARIVDSLAFVSLAEPVRYLERLRRALLAVLAEQALPPAEQATWRWRLALVLATIDDWEGARAELELAIPNLDHDPARAVRAMSLLAWPLDTASPASVNLQWLERAREVSAGMPVSPAQRLRLIVDRVGCLLMLGEEAGWDEAATVPPDGDTPEERHAIALAHSNNGDLAMMWGRYAAAVGWLARARELALTHSYARHLANIDIMRAHLDWFVGAWEGLAERVRTLANDIAALPSVDLETGLLSGLLDAATRDPAAAEQRFRLVLAEQLRRGRRAYAMEPGGALAWLCLEDGRAPQALEVTSELAAIISVKGLWIYGADLIPAHVAALAATGQTDDASRFVAAFAAGVGGRDAPVARAALTLSRALLAEAADDPGAGALFGAAATAWQALPRPYDALLARERQARCLFVAGQAADARALLGEVLRGLTELGATVAADRVARRLRDSGAQTRRPGAGRPGYGSQLSPRELDVVRLVADGQTNRQIAESLFLSPKTVATHVDAAMRKLNVTSRTALAVAAVTAGIVTVRTQLFIR